MRRKNHIILIKETNNTWFYFFTNPINNHLKFYLSENFLNTLEFCEVSVENGEVIL